MQDTPEVLLKIRKQIYYIWSNRSSAIKVIFVNSVNQNDMEVKERKRSGKWLKRILILSLLLNLALGSYVGYKKLKEKGYFSSAQPEGYGEYENNLLSANAEFLRMLPNDSNEIVFVGTSMTADFPLQEMFKNPAIKNRGIALTRTADVLKRIDEATESKPKKIFLEIGINDIGTGIPEDSIISNYIKILTTIKEQSPSSAIYVQSLFPSSDKTKTVAIESCNKKLEDYCKKNNIRFINLYQAFFKDGGIDTGMTFDGLQFNGKGYTMWKQLIELYVNE